MCGCVQCAYILLGQKEKKDRNILIDRARLCGVGNVSALGKSFPSVGWFAMLAI